jgi:hypothetical protein
VTLDQEAKLATASHLPTHRFDSSDQAWSALAAKLLGEMAEREIARQSWEDDGGAI